MEHVEPAKVMGMKLSAVYRDDTRGFGIFVPAVEKYENEEQEDSREVFTKYDLESEIETALSLGDDGILFLPALKPDGKLTSCWLSIRDLMWIIVDDPEPIDPSVFLPPAKDE